MSDKYSAQWVSEQLDGRDWMPLRKCSLCRQDIGYMMEGGGLYFSSACGCSSMDGLRQASWDDIANTLRMQRDDAIRDRIMATLKGEAPGAFHRTCTGEGATVIPLARAGKA